MFISGASPRSCSNVYHWGCTQKLQQCLSLGLHPGAVAMFITGAAPRSCSNVYPWGCTQKLQQCLSLGLHPVAVAMFLTGAALRSCSSVYHWGCTQQLLQQCLSLGLHPVAVAMFVCFVFACFFCFFWKGHQYCNIVMQYIHNKSVQKFNIYFLLLFLFFDNYRIIYISINTSTTDAIV